MENDWLTDELMQRATNVIREIDGIATQGTVYTVSRALHLERQRGKEEERERCAKIADEFAEREEQIWIENEEETGRAVDTAEGIAAAIRGS